MSEESSGSSMRRRSPLPAGHAELAQQNIDVVRRSLEAYARRDVAALRALAAPDVELDWSASRGWLAGVYRGIDDVLRFYRDYFDAFEEIVLEARSYTPAGDCVVVPNIAHQRGRGGIEVTAASTFVFTLRDRKLIRIHLYQEEEEALAAVGVQH